MTNLLTLLSECECWLGVEPTSETQVAEVAELRERVGKALATSSEGERRLSLMIDMASEKEPLPQVAASFLSNVAAKRGLDGLE